MKIPEHEFEFCLCGPDCLEEILDIQEETLALLPNPELLRRNTKEMLAECLQQPNKTLGARYKGQLVAFAVLYYPVVEEESLAVYLDDTDVSTLRCANLKLIIVRPDFRGNGLQYKLCSRLEEFAREDGVNVLCSTVSPLNRHSMANMLKQGFQYAKTIHKYGFDRNLYYKTL
jgi:GNAT superfamily N-acetyltransferase